VSPREIATPADAVRVWRGFLAPTMPLELFMERLSATFVPATVLMQIDVGLDAYTPAVLGGLPGKPAAVPDETAILFWNSQDAYHEAFEMLAARTYTLIHGSVYTPQPQSGAEFPLLFAGELVADQPYHLVAQPADWMHGAVVHLAGARPDGQSPQDFRARAAQTLEEIQTTTGLAGAIFCAGDDYLVYWALDARGAVNIQAGVEQLAALCAWQHVVTAKPTHLEKGLWEKWAGLHIDRGDCLNMQFTRLGER
jgi:hypothetical protein